MRILHIISRMDPIGGGPQEVVRLLLRYAPEGYEQEIVTLDDPSTAFLQTETATIHALGGSGKAFAASHLTQWLRANLDRFDGVMLHGLWEYASFAVLRAVAGHKTYVVFAHGMLDPYFKRAFPLKHLKKWPFWLAIQYWTLRRAHRVLFTTTAERDLAAQSFWLHRWNPMVAALGAEGPPQNLAACAEAFFQRCPSVRDRRYLLFLGRIDPKKGPDLLLEAFTALKGTGFSPYVESPKNQGALAPEGTSSTIVATANDLHLVMAGPDPDHWGNGLRATAQAAGVADRIHWPGMLTGDAKWGAFVASDAFILPSHQENFGIAVVEALACAKPVLITRPVNIAADLATDGCALVEDDTLHGTKLLLTRWLNLSSEQQAKMAQCALNSFANRYDMRSNARSILRCFEDTPAPDEANQP